MSSPLSPDHFLNQPHLDVAFGGVDGFVDTTTLAAHDFDVDTRTGFMPPDPPISRLPMEWELWEMTLSRGLSMELQLAVKPGLTEQEMARSASWRESVRNDVGSFFFVPSLVDNSSFALPLMVFHSHVCQSPPCGAFQLPVLPTTGLTASELLLRRAHHVLTFIMHMYIHTLPLDAKIRVPVPISIPLLQVAAHLDLPPIATYSDTVLYNWRLENPTDDVIPPALDNLRSQDLFTGSNDEQEFFLASSRIEIRGVEALELMRATMDEMFVGDAIAVRRITGYLHQLAGVVDALTNLLLDVRKGCDPEFFYHQVRPWFCGQDSDPMDRAWTFEGLEDDARCAGVGPPTDLSGPSAGQSALIHALDIFLGVDNCRAGRVRPPDGVSACDDDRGEYHEHDERWTLLRRMQNYMPRRHREFLHHLTANPRPVRDLVTRVGGGESSDPGLVEAYNEAVSAVRRFRDAHIRIVALYIIGPASRERRRAAAHGGRGEEGERGKGSSPPALKGTGGTHLVQFLRGIRDKTAEAVVDTQSPTRGG